MKKSLSDIYFYNAKALAQELRNGAVTEHRAVKHLVAAIILGGIGFEVPISIDVGESSAGALHILSLVAFFIVSGVISFYGVWLTHQVNTKGDGKDYFLRFSVLTLPIGIQLLVLFLWVGLALLLLSFAVLAASEAIGAFLISILFYLVGIAFLVLFFIRMRNYIAIASGLDENV